MMIARIAALGFAAALALAVPTAPARADADNLTIAYPVDVPSWDPVAHTFPLAMSIFKSVFDSPLTYSADLKLSPNVVKEWKWLGEDGKAIELTLRDDVTFHNGDKLTSEDFRFSFLERQKADPQLATSGVWSKISDIEIQSPTKAVVKFSAAMPTAPEWWAFLGSFIMPKKYFESVGKEAFLAKPIGSGPYKLVEYQRDSRIVLEAYDKYWGKAPSIKRVVFQIVKDPSARAAAVQAGDADITTQLPIRETVRLNGVAGIKGRIDPFTDIILLQIANTGAFIDPNVRLAAHHAIDKEAISKAFFNGAAKPISVLAVPGSPGYVDGFSFPYSLDKAKEYLAKSGFGPDKPAKMHFFTTNGAFPNDFEMARAIAGMWKKVGIEAEVEVIELAKYYELNHAGKMPEATLYRWGNDTGDPEIYTGYILNPKLRFSAWKSDDIAEPIAKLFGETNYEKRILGYRDLNVMVVEKGYAMPLLQGVSTVAYRDNVGFTAYGNGWILPATMTKK
jgi:peptide/nickel transport system substrate-binding protein